MNSSLGNITAIAKRELVGYFSSPVAYVFLVIFLLLGGFFTFMVGRAPFFEFGQASLVTFFLWQSNMVRCRLKKSKNYWRVKFTKYGQVV